MSLTFRTAARTEALLDAFTATVRDHPLRGPLVREAVLVARSTALRATVETALARQLGCAASVDVQSPRLFVAELARRFGLVPPAPAGRAFEAGALAWRIAALLPGLRGPLYAPLTAYLDRQAEAERGGGAFALATRLAAAFDDYQVYRPEVLETWQRGEAAVAGWAHEPWQADLWRTLVSNAPAGTAAGEPAGTPGPPGAPGPELDRATVIRTLTARLGRPVPDATARTLPQRVSVFGAPLLPPAYLRVLAALAAHVPVTLYAAVAGLDGGPDAPGPAVFGSAARHPLLRALGGHTRDAADLFDELGVPAPTHTPAAAAAMPASALHTLQTALLADTPPAGRTPLAAADRSVRVLDAHSALREVEALRDELYDAFDALPGLRPADVAILVPDLATYAPVIEAVFATSAPRVAGGRRARPAALPVHVADPPRAPERHVLDAFGRLLGLLDGRATASDLLGLLDVPAVRRAAGIDESELATVHGWVRQTRVHWGRDAAHRARHRDGDAAPAEASAAEDDGDLHTWRFGLDRLLLGVMTGPTPAVVLGRRPAGEGTLDAADLLGRLAEWLDALFGGLDALRDARPLAAWADALLLFVDRVLAPEGTVETTAVVALRAAADRLATLRPPVAAGAPEPAVALGEVQAHLAHALATLDRDEPYLTGRITVVDPTAARLVPFRVLAVVGLGDAFPRSDARPAFDLLAATTRPGDPDPAGTDRQTFLDAVLAARDRLILTFTGRSQRDGTERAASACLDAFLDTCAATFTGAERLVVRHRLQPFSPAYFPGATAGDAALFTYAARRAPGRTRAGAPFFAPPASDLVAGAPGDAPAETTLDALADAWTHPVRAFCSAAGLRPNLADADLRDDAPAELDALDLYAVKDGLLALLTAGSTVDDAHAALRGTGVLPPGALGRAWFDRAHGLVADVAARAGEHGPARRVALTADAPAWRVSGTLTLAMGGALRVRASRVGPRDLVRGWVDHLALCAQTADGDGVSDGYAGRRTVVVGQDRTAAFAPVAPDDARALLQALVRGALAFAHVPVPLFQHASHAYAQAMWTMRRPEMEASVRTLLDAEAAGWRPVRVGRAFDAPRSGSAAYAPALALARAAFADPYAPACDADDPYVALCYRNQSPADAFPDALDCWARLLWAPLMNSLESERV